MSFPGSTVRRRWADLALRTKGLIVVAIPLLALIAAGVVFVVLQRAERSSRDEVDHSSAVRHQIQLVTVDLVNAETGARGYLLTQQPDFLEPFRSGLSKLTGDIDALSGLVTDNPEQAARAARVRSLAAVDVADLQPLATGVVTRNERARRAWTTSSPSRSSSPTWRPCLHAG